MDAAMWREWIEQHGGALAEPSEMPSLEPAAAFPPGAWVVRDGPRPGADGATQFAVEVFEAGVAGEAHFDVIGLLDSNVTAVPEAAAPPLVVRRFSCSVPPPTDPGEVPPSPFMVSVRLPGTEDPKTYTVARTTPAALRTEGGPVVVRCAGAPAGALGEARIVWRQAYPEAGPVRIQVDDSGSGCDVEPRAMTVAGDLPSEMRVVRRPNGSRPPPDAELRATVELEGMPTSMLRIPVRIDESGLCGAILKGRRRHVDALGRERQFDFVVQGVMYGSDPPVRSAIRAFGAPDASGRRRPLPIEAMQVTNFVADGGRFETCVAVSATALRAAGAHGVEAQFPQWLDAHGAPQTVVFFARIARIDVVPARLAVVCPADAVAMHVEIPMSVQTDMFAGAGTPRAVLLGGDGQGCAFECRESAPGVRREDDQTRAVRNFAGLLRLELGGAAEAEASGGNCTCRIEHPRPDAAASFEFSVRSSVGEPLVESAEATATPAGDGYADLVIRADFGLHAASAYQRVRCSAATSEALELSGEPSDWQPIPRECEVEIKLRRKLSIVLLALRRLRRTALSAELEFESVDDHSRISIVCRIDVVWSELGSADG